MGNFYVSLSVNADAEKLFGDLMEMQEDQGLVGPLKEGWMVCLSEKLDAQDPETIETYGKALSKVAGVPVVSVLNHDDDVLYVCVYAQGDRIAAYHSNPGSFLEEPSEDDLKPVWSNAAAFSALAPGITASDMEALFKVPPLFAVELHGTLARTLGLPEYGVGVGFTSATEMGGDLWHRPDSNDD
jgi:hypothetical protein